MADFQVEIVEKLGDRVAFKKKSNQVRQSFYETIPEVHRGSLSAILNIARDKFEVLMQDDRVAERYPRSMHHKKQVLEEFLNPWLIKVGATKEARQPRTYKPRKPRLHKKEDELIETEPVIIDQEKAGEIYNTFSSDILSDSLPSKSEEEVTEEVDFEDNDFKFDGDVFEGLSMDEYL